MSPTQPKPIDLNHGIGRMLRAMRRARDMTQRQVAEKSGMSTSTISEIESGHNSLSIDVLWRLCVAMDTRPHVSLRGKDSHRPLLEIELASVGSVPIEPAAVEASSIDAASPQIN